MMDTKVLVWLGMANKGKGKNIIIDDPRTKNVSRGVDTRKALDKRKANRIEGAREGGKHDRVPNHGHVSYIHRSVQTIRPDN